MRSIEISITTLSPLCHASFDVADAGNAVTIRREPIVSLPGMPRVPCLSGNSIRGQCRRLIMREIFQRADLGVGQLPGKQWDLLYGALANGGHLTGAEKSPNPGQLRDMRVWLPPLSVFGAALYHYLLPGRVRFGWVWPVCLETVAAGLVEAGPGEQLLPAGDIVTETGLVRHVDRDEQYPTESGVTPMPVSIEAIATGVRLYAEVMFSSSATEIEMGAVAWGLDRISATGGKSAGGLGMIRLAHSGDVGPYQAWLDSLDLAELRVKLVDLAESLT